MQWWHHVPCPAEGTPPHRILLRPRPHHQLWPFLLLIQDSRLLAAGAVPEPFPAPQGVQGTHTHHHTFVSSSPCPLLRVLPMEFTCTTHCGSDRHFTPSRCCRRFSPSERSQPGAGIMHCTPTPAHQLCMETITCTHTRAANTAKSGLKCTLRFINLPCP